MEDTPKTTPDLDPTKAQPEQAQQDPQTKADDSSSFETGQADYGNAGETQLEQRQNQETGQSQRQPESGEAESGFVGSQSDDEGSDDLVERDEP